MTPSSEAPCRWHLLTGEYPPAPGGVSDYTRLVAQGLAAAGDAVEVWAPDCGGDAPADPGVRVNWLPSNFRPGALHVLERALSRRPSPRRLLVQYVPHAFGFKAMNVGLIRWLFRARHRECIWVMFHEVYYPRRWNQPLRHNFLSAVQRWMARQVARAAWRRFVSTPYWKILLHSLCHLSGPTEWLPIPSTVATEADPKAREAVRTSLVPTDCHILGYFGTFPNSITPLLTPPLLAALQRDARRVTLLMGRGGEDYARRLRLDSPDLKERIIATGSLDPQTLANHLAACDLVLQPFPEGATTRRTSLMASTALGLPIVTSRGSLTESVWDAYRAVCLTENTTAAWTEAVERLLTDSTARTELGRNARRLYQERFSVERTIDTLRTRHREDIETKRQQ